MAGNSAALIQEIRIYLALMFGYLLIAIRQLAEYKLWPK